MTTHERAYSVKELKKELEAAMFRANSMPPTSPAFIPHEFLPPCSYPDAYDCLTMYSNLRPTPPGSVTSIHYFHGDGPVDWEKQSQDKDLRLLEARHLGKLGLHCYNLEKGTNLKFLGVHERSRCTGIPTQNVIFEAEDQDVGGTHRFDTLVYVSPHKDSLTVMTTTVPPAPEKEGDCCCFSILAAGDESFKGDMPDWLPEDASNNKLQFYEMKVSEVEQEKEWLHLYAQLALYSKLDAYNNYYFNLPIELGKIIVESTPVVGSKKKMVLAENAIFYMTFKSSDGQDYKCIVRRTRVGRPGEKRLSLKVKCCM